MKSSEALGFLGAVTALAGVAYFVSRHSIFVGMDFLTPGLTREQIGQMDKHNDHEHRQQQLSDFGAGLIGFAQSQEVDEKNAGERKRLLDLDTHDLPSPLNHTH